MPGKRRLPDRSHFYFVHSFFAVPGEPEVVAVEASHGIDFCAGVVRENLVAVQFHPEKSQDAGELLIRAWLEGD